MGVWFFHSSTHPLNLEMSLVDHEAQTRVEIGEMTALCLGV